MTTLPFRRLAPLLAATLAAVTLAACGSDSDSARTGAGDDEQRLAFQDCLRAEGIDAEIAADGRMAVRASREADAGGTRDGGEEVFERCRRETGWAPPEPSEAEQQEMRDRALEFARCMREHGVDMADPAGGRVTLRVDESNAASVERAQRACGELMGGGPAMPAEAAP